MCVCVCVCFFLFHSISGWNAACRCSWHLRSARRRAGAEYLAAATAACPGSRAGWAFQFEKKPKKKTNTKKESRRGNISVPPPHSVLTSEVATTSSFASSRCVSIDERLVAARQQMKPVAGRTHMLTSSPFRLGWTRDEKSGSTSSRFARRRERRLHMRLQRMGLPGAFRLV